MFIEDLSKEQDEIDNRVARYSIELLQPFYKKRREELKAHKCHDFWKTVFIESGLLDEYFNFDDTAAFESLKDVYIEWDLENYKNFELTMSFDDNKLFKAQTFRKNLVYHSEGDEEYYTSPEPDKIELKTKLQEDSFFTFFEYTNSLRKKTRARIFEIASIIVSEIYPAALGLYTPDADDLTDEYDISE